MSTVRFVHYLILAAILFIGGLLFFRFQHFPNYQFITIVGIVLAYWLWGIGHHHYHRRLTRDVILEYVFIGFVVILMFAAALNLGL